MAKKFLPDPATEIARYQAHQNGPKDVGYLQFLNLAISPTLPYLNNSKRGLDYGCGPVPTLSGLLKTHGLNCENYDPYFFPQMPDNPFDFIFATEVVEHFFNPGEELKRIGGLLVPGGILTIMTEPWTTLLGFSEWYYARDITHVCFYHAKTIEFICTRFGFALLNFEARKVSVLKKLTIRQ